MISPRRAPVRPRVVLSGTRETVLLEDLVDSIDGQERHGPVEILGGPRTGKTTALAHLASFPVADRLMLVDDAGPADVPLGVSHRLVVYTTRCRLRICELRCELAPWGDDDLIEYLLGADFQDANLQGAHLSEQILRRAILLGADLSGSNLSRCDLEFLELPGALHAKVHEDYRRALVRRFPFAIFCATRVLITLPDRSGNKRGFDSTGGRSSKWVNRSGMATRDAGCQITVTANAGARIEMIDSQRLESINHMVRVGHIARPVIAAGLSGDRRLTELTRESDAWITATSILDAIRNGPETS